MQNDSHDCVEMNTTNPEDLSHQTGYINKNGKQCKNEEIQDNYFVKNGNKHNIELGTAKTEKPLEPLQVCTSFRTSNTTSNGITNPSFPEADVSCVRNCFQSCRTNHDCSEAEPEIIEVPERQSVRIQRNAGSGAFRCYQAVRLGFLQCLEDTPIVVPGLVLTILFCVTIIVITATGRVSQGLKPFVYL